MDGEEGEKEESRVKNCNSVTATNKPKTTEPGPSAQLILTFPLSGAKAAALVRARCRAMVDGRGFCIAFTAGHLAMDLIGQIP